MEFGLFFFCFDKRFVDVLRLDRKVFYNDNLGKIGRSITLAMANPLNQQAVEDVEMICGSSIQVFVSTTTDIRNAIEKYYRGKK